MGNVALVAYLLWYHYHVNNDMGPFYFMLQWGEIGVVVISYPLGWLVLKVFDLFKWSTRSLTRLFM